MVFLQIVAKSLIKKLPERHGSNNIEHRQALAAFPFFYDLESEITLSKKQRFHRAFFDAGIGFYRVLFEACRRIIFELKLILIKSNE